ncbi:hypothetical protein RFI_27327, partial [Reticulomyxa filosa]
MSAHESNSDAENSKPRLKERDDGKSRKKAEKREQRKARRKLSNASLDPNLFRKLTTTKHIRQNTKVEGPNSMTREELTAYESLRQQQQKGALPQSFGNYGNEVNSNTNMIDIRDIEPYVTQLLEQKQQIADELKESQDSHDDLQRRHDELHDLVNDYQKQLEKLHSEKEQHLHEIQL